MFDAYRLWRIIERICHERGTAFTRDFTLNDMSAHLPFPDEEAGESDPPPPATTLSWSDSDRFPVVLLCNPVRLAPELMLALTVDLEYVGEPEAEDLLRGIVSLLAAAATDDVDMTRIGEITGVPQVVRDADWAQVDSSWIRLSSVRQLLADALPAPAHVTLTEAGLVAYVTATRTMTPEDVHAAVMARLPGRHTAMAPAHYILCAGTPENPDTTTRWQALTVLAEGDGRVTHTV